ncbi:hypothetical protein P2H89_08140 [Paraflavitalea sp. CAU 1676]|nr:hypothetical protein [Paraflavitalea sp. CAU 1676]
MQDNDTAVLFGSMQMNAIATVAPRLLAKVRIMPCLKPESTGFTEKEEEIVESCLKTDVGRMLKNRRFQRLTLIPNSASHTSPAEA